MESMPTEIDFSNVIHYIQCPRFWYLKNVLQLLPDTNAINPDLAIGKAVHSGLEAGFNKIAAGNTDLEHLDFVSKTAFDMELEGTETEFDSKKNPEMAKMNLEYFWERNESIHANMEVLDVEMPFALPLGDGLPMLYGTVDLVYKMGRQLYLGEHKTTKSLSQEWGDGWALSLQVDFYAHAVRAYYGETPRIAINGLVFNKNAPDNKTFYINKNEEHYTRSMLELRQYLMRMKHDFQQLTYNIAGNSPMDAFPRNPTACYMYRPCMYRNVCASYTQPYKLQPTPGWTIKGERNE